MKDSIEVFLDTFRKWLLGLSIVEILYAFRDWNGGLGDRDTRIKYMMGVRTKHCELCGTLSSIQDEECMCGQKVVLRLEEEKDPT